MKNVGQKLKQLRKEKRVTLVELSKLTNVQVATISRIENGKMTGTIESHIKMASALGLDITELYSNLDTPIIESDLTPDISPSSETGDIFVHSQQASYEFLTKNVLTKQMLPVLLTIESGGETNLEQNPTGSEKFIYILEGSARIEINNRTYQLKTKHSLYFDATAKHQIFNDHKKILKAIVVTTPVFV